MTAVVFFFLCSLLAVGTAEALIAPSGRAKLAQRRFAITQAEPAVGTMHALTVFARFADQGDRERLPHWAIFLFAADYSGSLTHYYREMSRGRFSLEGTVLPRWYVAAEPAAAYLRGAGEVGVYGRFSAFVREVLDQVDEEVDFGDYDNDGPDGQPNSGDDDGYVDYLFLNAQSIPKGFIVSSTTGIARLGLGND